MLIEQLKSGRYVAIYRGHVYCVGTNRQAVITSALLQIAQEDNIDWIDW